MPKYTLAIHGGAGTILRSEMTAEKEKAHQQALLEALRAGEALLEAGESALVAVESAVRRLEDCEYFNAGKGAVFTHEGYNEMDASIMCGKTLAAGGVAMVRGIKNPISLARCILEASGHVLLCGPGALQFAREQGLEEAPPEYFFSEFRYRQLQEARARGKAQLDHSQKYGTVGAVACDRHGHIAAATSTGGLTNKQYGRVGDSPLIGAGTYANDLTCAVSCTGYGEYFMRGVVAYDVSCLMEYKGMSLEEAAHHAIHQRQLALGGDGGLIAVDAKGNVALPFNSAGMYRGWVREGEEAEVEIY
ncbi:MAG: isoaspartyl peptidase/L-asparaginase [Lewinellaceae bacterium]|nr:isoaspartyl peptidase/L-asparaginase [Phaeodactylibacter sp.]MCB9350631.1 isoaspartyl peptidase/L-asparaginase [Lewinellaceae bacterium]